jgi:hypothetical protein
MNVRFSMTNRCDPSVVSEHVLAALEAESGALRALEAASASISDEGEEARREKEHIDHAIELLRAAIAELRMAGEEHPHPGAAGFILAVQRRRRQQSERPEAIADQGFRRTSAWRWRR